MSSISAGTTSTTTLVHSGDTTGSLVFKTNDTGSGGTTAVTIDTSQNVLVGGTTFDNGGFSGGANGLNVVDATHPIVLIKESTTGTKAFFGTSSTQSYLWTPSNVPLAFGTNDTERMRINSSGYLLFGCTALPSSSVAGASLSPSVTSVNPHFFSAGSATGSVAQINFINGNGTVGQISTSGSGTTYATSSDYRLKNTIAPMAGALAKVQALKPVTYKWNADNSDGEGFIAHELQAVVPDAVTGEKDAVDAEGNPVYQGIDTSFLVATLTAAIQELKAINDQQAETINALTARVVALEGQ